MPRTRSPLAVQSYSGRSTPLTAQRAVNLYAEQAPPDAKSKVVLYNTPGLREFANPNNGNARGLTVLDNLVYMVAGKKLYSVTAGGTVNELGDVPGRGPVKMVPGRSEIFLLLNTNDAYVWDGATVSKITDTDFPTPSDVTYQDGYHIISEKGSDQFNVSNLLDADAWDALDFATSEALGDRIVGLVSDRRELWIFNVRSTEVWYNSGASDFPFERRDVIQRGCLARDSIVRLQNTIVWLGNDGIVYQAAGYEPQRISTHAVEFAVRQETNKQDIAAYSYTQEGHIFYVMRLLYQTWVYDMTTGFWHERDSQDRNTYRVADAVGAFGRVLGIDYNAGKLYELDLDTHTEDGETIVREAQTPPLHAERRRVFMSRFEVEAEMGVGTTTGEGADAEIDLFYSDDGGRTYKYAGQRSLGAKGEYRQRAKWHRLGAFRERTLRVRVSDPVKIAITAMVADMEAEQGQ